MPKITELRKQVRERSPAELATTLIELRTELAVLTVKARQGAMEQPNRIRQTRRQIARILTALHEPAKKAA